MATSEAVRATRAERRRAAGDPRGNAFTRRLDRLLAFAADAPRDEQAAATRLQVLRRFLLAWGAARSWIWLAIAPAAQAGVFGAAAVVLSVAAALSMTARFEHVAARIALPALFAELLVTLPLTPNHFFVELYAVVLLCFAAGDRRDDLLVLSGLRWLVALVLFHTGLQKLLYGHYLNGDFLAFMVGRGDRFADLFARVLPEAEVARLRSYDPFQSGAGPYRVAAPLFVALSNAVWVLEMVLPAALLARRTRVAAFGLAAALILALQLGAREIGFALLFVNLLLLFAPAAVGRALLPFFLAVLLWAVAATAGIVPGRGLVEAWHLR